MTYLDVVKEIKGRDMTMDRYERDEWDQFVKKTGLSLSFPFIHVAGTNGKGSTVHYLEAIYRKQGYKVAVFTSPYMHSPKEMIRMDGKEIPEAEFTRLYEEGRKLIEKCDLSEFEIETYIAFAYFNETKPDVAIVECGMGGETDATNIADAVPLLSVVTTISLEHTAFLGTTTSEIAEEVSGIIKKNSSVLIGRVDDEAKSVLQDRARRLNADVHILDSYHGESYASPHFTFDYRPYRKLHILSPSLSMVFDASVAVESVNILQAKLPVTEENLRLGLDVKPLPLRFERIGNVIIDGAHNFEAVSELMGNVRGFACGKPIHTLFACFSDKNISIILPRIALDSDELVLTTFDHPRARTEDDFFLYVDDYRFAENYKFALNDLITRYPNDLILVTGSLAFATLVRDYLSKEFTIGS